MWKACRQLRAGIAVFMGLLLAAQMALAHVPLSQPLDANHLRSVICGPDGPQTLILDLRDGSVTVENRVTAGEHCPVCVLGALAAAPYPTLFAHPLVLVADARVVAPAQQPPSVGADPARLIRAPPPLSA